MKSATIQLAILSCPACMEKTENAVKGLDGVRKDTVQASFNSSRINPNFDKTKISLEGITDVVTISGYGVQKARAK